MSYRIFTTKHDQILSIRELASQRPAMNLLKDEAARHIDSEAPVQPFEAPAGRPLTILVDCSGSTRGLFSLSTVLALRSLGDSLDIAGRPFEILGFTTSSWKGGQSYDDWKSAGRPQFPGRLSDLLHIVFKDIDQDWADARPDLDHIVDASFKKENIDGEAILWAQSRIEARGGEGAILVITDGVPNCETTLNENYSKILDYHLTEVLQDLPVPCHAVSMLWGWGSSHGYTESTEAIHTNGKTPAEYADIMLDSLQTALKALNEKTLVTAPAF